MSHVSHSCHVASVTAVTCHVPRVTHYVTRVRCHSWPHCKEVTLHASLSLQMLRVHTRYPSPISADYLTVFRTVNEILRPFNLIYSKYWKNFRENSLTALTVSWPCHHHHLLGRHTSGDRTRQDTGETQNNAILSYNLQSYLQNCR